MTGFTPKDAHIGQQPLLNERSRQTKHLVLGTSQETPECRSLDFENTCNSRFGKLTNHFNFSELINQMLIAEMSCTNLVSVHTANFMNPKSSILEVFQPGQGQQEINERTRAKIETIVDMR
jgi:hypothetical protein